MKLSARNKLKGKIVSIELGAVMANVKIELGTGEVITAAITKDSAEGMDLAEENEVYAVIKATEVMVAKDI